MKKEILNKIRQKKSIIGIIGLGYVGLPLVLEFMKKNFKVFGFDVDLDKVNKLNKGECYIKHINQIYSSQFLDNKDNFLATSDFSRLKEVDFILICVPTPLDDHYNPDLSFVLDSTREVAKYLRKGQVIILESTTYPETTQKEMLPILETTGLCLGKDFFLGYSPEREDPGNKEYSTSSIPKVVSAITKDGGDIVEAFYQNIVQTVRVSSPKVAEASKILENTYRAVNIALVNELKMIFDRMDIDIWEVIKAAKTKPFGFKAFYPGPGLGGHCIPIDPFYLAWKAREYDHSTRFIELAGEINTFMPRYVVGKAIKILNKEGICINNSRILISGVAYKPDIDDMRESPALKIIQLLLQEQCRIDYYDPYIPKLPKTRKYNFTLISKDFNKIKNDEYDLVLIITDHKNVNYKELIQKGKVIIDTRNILDKLGIKDQKIYKS